MPNITAVNAQAWMESTKLSFAEEIDGELETQLADEVYGRLDRPKDESPTATPGILRSIIGMRYASTFIERAYSEDDESSRYARMLWARSERLLEGVIDGSISLGPDEDRDTGPSVYPTDDMEPSFTMGQIF